MKIILSMVFSKKNNVWTKSTILGPKMTPPHNSGYPLSSSTVFFFSNIIVRGKKGKVVIIPNANAKSTVKTHSLKQRSSHKATVSVIVSKFAFNKQPYRYLPECWSAP